MYLREIGKVNLLNAQGENDLAKQVENGKIIKRMNLYRFRVVM